MDKSDNAIFIHMAPSSIHYPLLLYLKSTPRLKILLVLPSSSCCNCVLTVYTTTLHRALLHTQLGVVTSTMYRTLDTSSCDAERYIYKKTQHMTVISDTKTVHESMMKQKEA